MIHMKTDGHIWAVGCFLLLMIFRESDYEAGTAKVE